VSRYRVIGHVLAFVTIFFWGITFISTKLLLSDLSPTQILLVRFLIGYFSLWIAFPKFIKPFSFKDELLVFLAGISGITIYFLFENIALSFTTASNVGLLVSVAPITTAILAHYFTRDEKFTKNLFIGFVFAIGGIFLIVSNKFAGFSINFNGDLLALAAAISWGFYSIILKKIGNKYNYIHLTRKIFFYGVITIAPISFFIGDSYKISTFSSPSIIFNILFLGLIASALCFYMWSIALSRLGTIKASAYIYLLPLITMLMSVIVLNEIITTLMIVGACLIIIGTYLAENGFVNIKSIRNKK